MLILDRWKLLHFHIDMIQQCEFSPDLPDTYLLLIPTPSHIATRFTHKFHPHAYCINLSFLPRLICNPGEAMPFPIISSSFCEWVATNNNIKLHGICSTDDHMKTLRARFLTIISVWEVLVSCLVHGLFILVM